MPDRAAASAADSQSDLDEPLGVRELPAAGEPDRIPYATRAPVQALDTPEAVRSAPRFCRVCGAPWDSSWPDCPHCAARAAGMASAATASQRGREKAFGVGPALGLYFTLLSVSLVGLICGLAGVEDIELDFILSAAMSLVVLVWCARAGRPAWGPMLKPAPAKWFAVALAGAFGTFALASAIVEGVHHAFDVPKMGYSEPILSAGYGTWVVVLLICVQPALFEELAFRGVILSSLQPALSAVEAVFVSAMLFMVLHLAPLAFPHTLAMGVAAGFLCLRTGSLLPGILLHFVHNLLCIVSEMTLGW